VKVTRLFIIPALSLGLAFQASAQQSAASTSAADSKYCSTLAGIYVKTRAITQLMVGSEGLLIGGCDSNPRETIAALQKKFAIEHMDVPPHPALAKAGQ
jgi:hypothetical protein